MPVEIGLDVLTRGTKLGRGWLLGVRTVVGRASMAVAHRAGAGTMCTVAQGAGEIGWWVDCSCGPDN
jgi:hypothetical protein